MDGKKVDSRPDGAAGDLNTGNSVSIGQDPTGSYPESGAYDIDDLGVWRRALTPLDVTGIYMAATNASASFTGTYIGPLITIQQISVNTVRLAWPYGRLQQSDDASGPY